MRKIIKCFFQKGSSGGSPLMLLVLVVVLSFLLVGCEREEIENPFQEPPQMHPLMKAQGVSFVEWDSLGKKIWELKADSAIQFSQETILKNVRVKLFEEGKPVSESEADQITMDNLTSDLELKGKVKVISYLDGAQLTTSELKWVASEEKFFTEEKVRIKKDNLVIQGKGLIGNLNLTSIIIKEQVTTYFQSSES